MNIAIWGTGNVGKYVYENIKENSRYQIKYFVDSNKELWDLEIEGIRVISPQQLQGLPSGELEFVLVSFLNGISIYKMLREMNIGVFGIIRNKVFGCKLELDSDIRLDKNIFWSDAPYLDKPLLESLETNIVDYCNLNCRGCSHFSNLFGRGEKVPFDIFCKDLQQIVEHAYVYQFTLLGGEALLDDRVIDYIKFARKLLPDSDIQLVTNGLLIPNQPSDFFACCRENDIIVSVSGYRPTVALKNKIVGILDKEQITYIFRINKVEFGKNIDLTGNADPEKAVKRCRESRCHFLRNGKIYKCPFEALGNRLFEYYSIDISLSGGINIYDECLEWEKMIDDLSHNAVAACRYCGIEEKITWCATNAPVLEDWVVGREG